MFPPLISILVSKDHVYKVLPSAGLMMNRMAILHQNSGVLGDQPPLPSSFSSTLEISLRLRLGKYLGHRGWISQYLPRFDGAWIQCNQHAYKQHSQTLVLSHGNYNAITQGCVNDNTHTDEMGSKIGVKTQN